ncbi:MAG: cytochrome C oxidase subunit IV family protein [Planctomycetota bacterium]|nr:cytochrome C oxidase subunit IV family protein [Planctomycetota bacterium]
MSAHEHSHDEETLTGHHHVTSPLVFFNVLIALLLLTVVTVVVTRFDFGSANLLIAMLIASVKAALVIAIFMHVKWDTPINRVVFLSSFLFLSLLFIFTLADEATRGRANPENKVRAPVADEWTHPQRPASNQ